MAGVDLMQDQLAKIEQSELPIFSQDWWINIARGSSDYCESKVVRGDVVVGRLPYLLSRSTRLHLRRGQDLHWSHLGGPILDQRLNREEKAEVIRSLVEQLPRVSSFSIVCHPELSYADLVKQAFRQAGFTHQTQVTYVRYPSDDDVLSARKSKHRGHFKRAAKALECVNISAAEFVEFYQANLNARGKRSYSPVSTMKSLIEEAVSRGQARVIAAKRNSCGKDEPALYDAAIVYLWDKTRCYFWLSTRRFSSRDKSNEKPHPDAIKLLAVKAMEDAGARNLIFDADGVATPGAEYLYRHIFGLRMQRRDVFRRETAFGRFHQSCLQYFKVLLPNFGGIALVGNIAADILLS